MINLYEVLDTKYLTADYADDLVFMLDTIRNGIATHTHYEGNIHAVRIKESINQCISRGIAVIDLAGCNFVQKVWDVISRYSTSSPDIISFVDTGDEERDKFIRTLVEENQNPNKATKPLPIKPPHINDFTMWAQQLDEDEIYDALDYEDHPEVILLLQLLRPEINIVSPYKKMFAYGKRIFSRVLFEDCTEFMYIPSVVDEYWETRLNKNGTVHVLNLGNLPLHEFVTKYECIPADIGRKQFIYSSSSDAWRESVKQLMLDVAAYLADKPITISTYYPEGDLQ